MNDIDNIDFNLGCEFHKEISRDILRIYKFFPTKFDKSGDMVPECDLLLLPIPTVPKTSSKSSHRRAKYKKYLNDQISKAKKELKKFKNKEILVYVIAYLTKTNYREKDVDNLAKPVLDILKEFISDDNKVKILIVEKKLVPDDPIIESGLKEQFLILITTPEYGEYLLKENR